MSRRPFAALIIGTLTFAFVGVPAPAFALSRDEAQFVSLINHERSERDRRALVVKDDLVSIAHRHSARMAADETVYHNRNLGNEVSGRWWTVGENVGMGPSVESLHDAFMISSGHRANIIDRDYNQVGVGVVEKDDTLYVTQVFAGRHSAKKSRVISRPTRARPAAAKPTARARPRAQDFPPPSRTIAMLLILAGLDAARVDPVTGKAVGP